jgi:hypothetical protein
MLVRDISLAVSGHADYIFKDQQRRVYHTGETAA